MIPVFLVVDKDFVNIMAAEFLELEKVPQLETDIEEHLVEGPKDSKYVALGSLLNEDENQKNINHTTSDSYSSLFLFPAQSERTMLKPRPSEKF